MLVKALVSADDSNKAWDLKCDIRESLIAFLRDHYPQHLPHLKSEFLPWGEQAQ